jgi:CBS domain-containing protein
MTPEPRTLSAESTVGEALELMEAGRYRTIPLLDEAGAPVGMLRQQDIIEYVAEAFPQEILNLPPRPHQMMEEQEGA